MDTMDNTSNNGSANSNGSTCLRCGVDLILGGNIQRSSERTCNSCVEKIKEFKTERPNTIKCNKCSFYKDNTEFYKILKNCIDCRTKQTKRSREKNSFSNNSEYLQENVNIGLKEIFQYLKTKYKFKDTLQQIIQEITETEDGDKMQEQP